MTNNNNRRENKIEGKTIKRISECMKMREEERKKNHIEREKMKGKSTHSKALEQREVGSHWH